MGTIWIIAISLHLISWILSQMVLKYLVDKGVSRTKIIPFLYFGCFLTIATYNLFLLNFPFRIEYLVVMLIALLNPYGNLCRISAYKHSLSKTNLVSPLSGILITGLSALLLSENVIYNPKTIIGSTFLFGAIFLLSFRPEKGKMVNLNWLLLALGMIVIEGGTMFSQKYFSSDIPKSTFFLYWYFASTISALPILFYREKANPTRTSLFRLKEILLIFTASLFLLGSTVNVYWAFQTAPAGLVEPIRRFGMAFLPIPIGWIIFKEKKQLTKLQIIGFILGTVGASFIIMGIY